MQCIARHYITLHYIALHCSTLPTLHCMTWYYITFTLQCMTYSWHCIALHFKHWKTLHNRTKHIITEHCITLPYLTLQHITLLSVTLQAYMHTCIHAYMHTYRQTDRPTHIHTYTHSKVQLKTKQNKTLHYLPLRCTALHYMTLHDIILITLHYLLLHRITLITLPYLVLHYIRITLQIHLKENVFKMFQDIRKQKEMTIYIGTAKNRTVLTKSMCKVGCVCLIAFSTFVDQQFPIGFDLFCLSASLWIFLRLKEQDNTFICFSTWWKPWELRI